MFQKENNKEIRKYADDIQSDPPNKKDQIEVKKTIHDSGLRGSYDSEQLKKCIGLNSKQLVELIENSRRNPVLDKLDYAYQKLDLI